MTDFRRKLLRALTGARDLPSNAVRAFWWARRTNFGDLITESLLARYQRAAIYQRPGAHGPDGMVMVGSLIQMLPHAYRGNILGTGLIRSQPYALPCARIWAVRGELTKSAMNLDVDTPTGDFGLLSNQLLNEQPEKTHVLGLVPHYVDKRHDWIARFAAKGSPDVLVIDVQRQPEIVIHDIARCHLIASSSLHGLIAADSLGVPSVWLQISHGIIGEGFKFRDYFSSMDLDRTPISCSDVNTISDLERRMTVMSESAVLNKQKTLDQLLRAALESI